MAEEKKTPASGTGTGESMRSLFERLGETLDVTAKSARLNLEIGALNSRRNALFLEMGRKVYDLFGKGLVKNAALLNQCATAADLDAQIAEKRAQIASLRGHHAAEKEPEQAAEQGIEEESVPPTSGEDLSEEEEWEIRPPGERKL